MLRPPPARPVNVRTARTRAQHRSKVRALLTAASRIGIAPRHPPSPVLRHLHRPPQRHLRPRRLPRPPFRRGRPVNARTQRTRPRNPRRGRALGTAASRIGMAVRLQRRPARRQPHRLRQRRLPPPRLRLRRHRPPRLHLHRWQLRLRLAADPARSGSIPTARRLLRGLGTHATDLEL